VTPYIGIEACRPFSEFYWFRNHRG